MAAPARTAGYLVHATRVVATCCRARAMDACTQLLGDGAKERRRVAVPRGNEETRGEERCARERLRSFLRTMPACLPIGKRWGRDMGYSWR